MRPMRLDELEPQFVRYETRDGREYVVDVATLPEAQGIQFLCPTCFQRNDGAVGTHAIDVSFDGRGVLDHQGSHGRSGNPSRWTVGGTNYRDLTLQPSIDITPGCDWHGFVTNGAIS